MASLFRQALQAHQAGQAATAETLYRQAIAAGEEIRSARHNLALLLVERRAFAEAKAHLIALIASPDADAATHFMLARILIAEGDEAAAIPPLEFAHSLEPGSLPIRLELARLLAARTELARASSLLALPSDKAPVPERLAALRARAEIEIAWADLDPAEEELHLAAAEEALRGAQALAPHQPALLNNLALLLRHRGRLAEAETQARQLLAAAPQLPESALTLAAVLAGRDPEREGEAVALLERTRTAAPDHPSVTWNLAHSLMRLRRWPEGWRHYARCFERPQRMAPPGPLWDGKPTGTPLLIWGEQGYGQVIQFARFLPRLADRSPHLMLACQRPLLRLLARLPGVGQVVDLADRLPSYGAHFPLLDLGMALGIQAKDLPGPIPYLQAPDADAPWNEIKASPAPRIGIVWAGNRQPDPLRSTTLDRFVRLAKRLDLRLFSLQIGPAAADIAGRGEGRIVDLAPLIRDFADTAAAIAGLDLVITIDTAMAHLAGALGGPAWVLLPHRAGWMWHFDQERSSWYPNLRLFRQAAVHDWDGVFVRVEAALAEWLGSGHARP
ncbi:MAG TPA: tetratricopeptide repeat protein [Hypericibacter adhaerens]|jgi:Tfp pilus assembly protein PilF|uniref:tetratricopeptide repeat protein n=1 Tax=Hypericibacter adhaerens TaxID=2602016 RepID=UPI002C32B16B|nr:tetratricopeptide repeat protein [Hypericibacter adhaerens]HWA43624.1 tetratricopeptide repeat protein [Hypericibacter adhaerens]